MNSKEIAVIKSRLKHLDTEKAELEERLATLLATNDSKNNKQQLSGSLTNQSGPSEKIALFRSLFLGREDVFPKRWQNTRTGKSGYAPACGNEWQAGVCGKPKVKCGECPNQNFHRVTDEVIDGHDVKVLDTLLPEPGAFYIIDRAYLDFERLHELTTASAIFVIRAKSNLKFAHRYSQQVELFFKWIKQHLRIKTFFGTSANAVKTQIWIAVSIYVLVAIIKKRLNCGSSLYTILQILSVTLFE